MRHRRRSLRAHRLAGAVLLAGAVVAAGPTSATPGASGAGGAGEAPRCAGEDATLSGTSGDDVLVGTPGDDVIFAAGGADRVDGRGGDDAVCGGPGPDVLVGGAGADRLFDGSGRGASDVLRGGEGKDFLRAYGGRDRLEMGAGDDRVLTTSSLPPVVRAGTGDDDVDLTRPTTLGGVDVTFGDSERGDEATLYGDYLRGRDDLTWDLRSGRLTGPDGRSGRFERARTLTVSYSSTGVRVRGTALGESLTALPLGRVTFLAGAGPDVFSGSPQRDTFSGGPGRDTYASDPQGSDRCFSVERDLERSCG